MPSTPTLLGFAVAALVVLVLPGQALCRGP